MDQGFLDGNASNWVDKGKNKQRTCVRLDLSSEFTRLLGELSGADLTDASGCVVVAEIEGRDQKAHMDSFDIRNLSDPHLSTVDRARFGSPPNMPKWAVSTPPNYVMPTLSFVIYFNDVGGCTFPHADMANKTIRGQRGRIIMFGNYIDSQRPSHDTTAMHFGTYEGGRKRVMTLGVLSNRMPGKLLHSGQDDEPVGGLLYTANKHQGHHQQPDPPRKISISIHIEKSEHSEGATFPHETTDKKPFRNLLLDVLAIPAVQQAFRGYYIGLGLFGQPHLMGTDRRSSVHFDTGDTFYLFRLHPVPEGENSGVRRMDVDALLLLSDTNPELASVRVCPQQDPEQGLQLALQTRYEAEFKVNEIV